MRDMKPVQSSLKKWMQENENFKERHLQMKQETLNDPRVQSFLSSHPNLSEREIDVNLNKLYEYKTQSKQCSHCNSLGGCQNVLKGYTPILYAENEKIHLAYEKCHSRLEYEKHQEQHDLIQSLYMPKDILQATIGQIENDDKRRPAIRKLLHFIEQTKKTGLPSKGFYFYGPFGVGKTYFLGALANELKKQNISSMLIYMPEFVREIRDSFKDDSVNEKVNFFKNADVLMIDDIGAETQSAWFRDEVLGSILQYRMMERLPVFFTSNYSLDQLEEQLAVTTRGGVEKVKAGRIMERIRQVSEPVPLFSKNRRR